MADSGLSLEQRISHPHRRRTIAGELSIHRRDMSGSDSKAVIELTDRASGVKICEVLVDFKSFGRAMLGLSVQECIVAVNDSFPFLGCERERKTIKIKTLHSYKELNDDEIDVLVKDHEIEGWKVTRHDLNNFKNRGPESQDGFCWVTVNCHRYVDPEGNAVHQSSEKI